jgi:hypothetical protein
VPALTRPLTSSNMILFCRRLSVVYTPAQATPAPAVVHRKFDKVALVHLQEPTSPAGEDIVNMLKAMARFLPRDEGKFDVHLALAEIYQTADRAELAQLHIEQVPGVKPARFDPKRGPVSAAYRWLGLDQ